MEKVAEQLINGDSTMEELTKDMKYYDYYKQAYGAVLDGMVGTFQAEIPADEVPQVPQSSETVPDTVWVTKYGLKAFFPLAKNFPYNDFDDFGVSRSYGFRRRHLGHDMMGQVGTPIIAVESGYVEALGWNQYGGCGSEYEASIKRGITITPTCARTTRIRRFKRGQYRDGRRCDRISRQDRVQHHGEHEQYHDTAPSLRNPAHF